MIKKYYVEEKIDGKYVYRDPTEEELNHALAMDKRRDKLHKKIDKAEKELKQMRKDPSKVFYDEPGFPYDVRHFVAPGRTETI